MTQEVLCPSCGVAVPRGRLSCQECGTMLASVAGLESDASALEASTEAAAPTVAAPDPQPPAADPAAADDPASEPPPAEASPPEPSASPAEPSVVAVAPPDQPSSSITEPPPIIGQWSGPPPDVDVPEESVLAAGPAMTPTRVVVMGAPTGSQRKFGEPLFPTAMPAPPAEEAKAEVPTGTTLVEAPSAAAGWLVVAGGVVAGVSFLLPWADVVLGSGSISDSSYLGHWGLANAPNILLMLVAFGIAYLAVAPLRRFTWLRTGALPILAGGLLLGVTWPYVLGPYGPRLGLWVTVIGAILLLVGGFLALYEAARHGEEATEEPDEG